MSEVKTTVLEMMPHFTERESIVQKQLDKAKGERVSKTRDDDDDDDDDARADRAPAPAVPQPTRAPSDLISGLGDEPAPRPPRQPAALTTCSAAWAGRPRPRPRPRPRQRRRRDDAAVHSAVPAQRRRAARGRQRADWGQD